MSPSTKNLQRQQIKAELGTYLSSSRPANTHNSPKLFDNIRIIQAWLKWKAELKIL